MFIEKNEKRGLGAMAALTALMLSASAFASTVSAPLVTEAVAATSPAGMKVVRDSATGALRAPTPAEAQAMVAQEKVKGKVGVGMLTGTEAPQQQLTSTGAVRMELSEETMVYSVVKRADDGSLNMECVTGSDAAKKLINSKSPATKQEHKHDK